MPARRVITLLTDFGCQDAYVAAMKGVILGINPEAILVDITHDIPAQDILAGALVLAAAAPYFPPDTIHLAVVDPGVGGTRRGLAAKCRNLYYVGPDNGLFALAWASDESQLSIVSLSETSYFRTPVAPTFHGRDIFAPVAAHLSLGVVLSAFGPPLPDPVLLSFPHPTFGPETVQGEIIYQDHFGNLVSNVRGKDLLAWLTGGTCQLEIGSQTLTSLQRTYAEVSAGELLALIGSHGYLEVACAFASAAQQLGSAVGTPLLIRKV